MKFRRWVVFTFLIHVGVVVVDKGGGLVLYLLTRNQPAQHGNAGAIASLPFILMAVANLGLATSLVYMLRKGRVSPQRAFSSALTVALTWGTLVGGAAAAIALGLLPAIDPEWKFDPMWVAPVCAAVPLMLVSSYANSVQLATERVTDYGVVHLASSLSFLPAFFLFFYWLGGSVPLGHVPIGVAWGRLASTVLVATLALVLVRKVVRLRLGWDREFLREALHYGWKANLTSTLTYLNHRVDLLVVIALNPGDQAGFYNMSITWAELVWHFPEAMRDLFFSKVAGSTHETARELTPVLARLGLAVSLLGGTAVLLLMNPAMTLITSLAQQWSGGTGNKWVEEWSQPVFGSVLVLLPGTVAYTVSKVLQADLAGRNRLQTCVNAQFVVLVVMLALDFLWIPGLGSWGAALASSVAYVASTVYSVLVYARETGTPVRDCLLAKPADLRYIREIVSAIWQKVRRRP